MAGIIGIPGRLQLEWVADFARNPRPTSSECAGVNGPDFKRTALPIPSTFRAGTVLSATRAESLLTEVDRT